MKTKAPEQVEIRIPRRAEFVRVARMAACAVASRMGFTIDIIKDIELAVGEACANAVEHVRVDDESSDEIIIRFTLGQDQLALEVMDRGQGFDPDQARKGEADEWDEPGGLGLFVIRALMDELHVECDPATGTCVRMVKRRTE
jgi:serine/threonine-protein kinase RsbW